MSIIVLQIRNEIYLASGPVASAVFAPIKRIPVKKNLSTKRSIRIKERSTRTVNLLLCAKVWWIQQRHLHLPEMICRQRLYIPILRMVWILKGDTDHTRNIRNQDTENQEANLSASQRKKSVVSNHRHSLTLNNGSAYMRVVTNL